MRSKVAIVEDNFDNRLLVSTLLEDDYDCIEFEDAFLALESFEREGLPDIVLIDISLPGMDGVEALRHIRERFSKTLPVIALTAHAMDGDREHFLAQGFDEYVTKPILDENVLLNALQGCLKAQDHPPL